jgi:hypothetical protein
MRSKWASKDVVPIAKPLEPNVEAIEVMGGAQEPEASSSLMPHPENRAAAKDLPSPLPQSIPT